MYIASRKYIISEMVYNSRKEIPVKHNGIQFMKRNTEEDSNRYDL